MVKLFSRGEKQAAPPGFDMLVLPSTGLGGLLVAAPWGGMLRYVANVRSGFTDLDHRCLAAVLKGHCDNLASEAGET